MRNSLSIQQIHVFFLSAGLGGLASLIFLFSVPSGSKNTALLGFSVERLAIAIGILAITLPALWVTILLQSRSAQAESIRNTLKKQLNQPRLSRWLVNFSLAGLLAGSLLVLQQLALPSEFSTPYMQRLMPFVLYGTGVCALVKLVLLPHVRVPHLLPLNLLVAYLPLIRWFAVLTEMETVRLLNLTPFVVSGVILLTAFSLELTNRFEDKNLLDTGLRRTISGTAYPSMRRFLDRMTIYNGLWLVLLIGLGTHYYVTATGFSPVIVERGRHDQGAYMKFAREVKKSGFTYTGGRNRMPLYPYLQAVFYDPTQSDDIFFQRGKTVNIVLSLVLAILLFFLFKRYLPIQETANLTLIVAFGVFIYKSPYFQAEILYYFLSFVGFLGMAIVLIRPTLVLGIGTGFVLALAHLTKASILPGVLVFVSIFLLKEGWMFYRQRVDPSFDAIALTLARVRWASLALLLVSFFGVLSPYLLESKRVYTRYFYNVNSNFYFWNDSWKEVVRETRAHGDRVGWPDMPPDQIPSLRRYLREHTLDDIVDRMRSGFGHILRVLSNPYGLFNYLGISLVFLISVALLDWRNTLFIIQRYWIPIGFALTYFIGYLVLIAWYIFILSNGTRLILGLYIPFIFSTFIALRELTRQMRPVRLNRLEIQPASVMLFANAVLFGLVMFDIFAGLPVILVQDYFGW